MRKFSKTLLEITDYKKVPEGGQQRAVPGLLPPLEGDEAEVLVEGERVAGLVHSHRPHHVRHLNIIVSRFSLHF